MAQSKVRAKANKDDEVKFGSFYPSTSHTIPDGFIIPAGAQIPNWDFEASAAFSGTVVSLKTINKKKPRKGETPTTRLLVIQDNEGASFQVWESAGLKGLFDEVSLGDSVYIHYDGLGPKVPGKNQMKMFSTGYKKAAARARK